MEAASHLSDDRRSSLALWRRGLRQLYRDERTDPRLALDHHLTPHRRYQMLDDRQAQPGASGIPAPAFVDPVEAFEQPRKMFGLDAQSAVSNLDHALTGF